jgi:hypothetical protein
LFEILAPDGKRYPIDSAAIKIEEGVDLALVQFTSKENYQIATLADYNPNQRAPVFLGGYPKLGQKDPKWRFEAGFIFEKERGIVQTLLKPHRHCLTFGSDQKKSMLTALRGCLFTFL